MIRVEYIDRIFYRKINPSDFKKLYDIGKPENGGGQTYVEAAGISEEDIVEFLNYAEISNSKQEDEKRFIYTIYAHVLGDSKKADFIEFAPRSGRINYKISRQNMKGKHPAWSPDNGFPEPRKDSSGEYISEKKFAGIIDNLLIIIVRTTYKKYYAGFVNVADCPQGWPVNIGLNTLFDGERRGVLQIKDKSVEFVDSLDNPFGNVIDTPLSEQIELEEKKHGDDITTDILNHNLFGIHIKGQNDALSEDRPHICIGWSALGDLSNVNSKEELTSLFAETWPDAKSKSQGQNIGQVWRFKNDIQIGDYVAFSDGNLLHIGRVESDYYYDGTPYSTQDSDYKNSRNVVWLKKNIQRTELSETLHRTLGVGMSIWTMNDYRAAIADLINGTYVKYEDEDGEESTELCYYTHFSSSKPRNRIIFGAPGTGKSFMLNRERKELLGEDNNADYERVTFHPDYSYANFVGTYKPISAFDSEGKEIITYEYVPGPFMRVYVNALKNGRTDDIKPFLLIIEEINRANIAAVFGDIFQLLDRDENQVSEYPIQASEDMKKYLAKELGGEPDDYAKIKLPDNMFIWATMNSADQGVYPMDTAFKRRWNFEYIGINDGENKVDYNVKIPVKNNIIQKVKWNTLRKRINDNLLKEEVNEDKLLGPFFISKNALKNAEKDSEAFAKIFKSKVIMYLFEDVARQKKIRNNVFSGFANNNSTITLSGLFGKFDEIGVKLFGLDDKEFEEKDKLQPSNDNSGNESKDGDPSDGSAIDNPQEKVQLEESVETTESNSLSEDATGEGEN